MILIDYVLHSHTYRCKHAVKDIEDYVTKCIQNSYRIYGVSDHVFLPGVHSEWMRGDYSQLDEYINEFKRCKKIYGKSIDMRLGFECEHSVFYEKYYESLIKEKGFDYLICGQHLGFDENGQVYYYLNETRPDEETGLIRYKNDLVNAMKSGLYLYIAHPDVCFVYATSIKPIYEKVTKEILDAAEKYDIALEVNINGFLREKLRNGVIYIDYPNDYFWEQVSKRKIKVVCGGDLHNPDVIDNKEVFKQTEDFIKKHNLKLASIDEVYNDYKQRLKIKLKA